MEHPIGLQGEFQPLTRRTAAAGPMPLVRELSAGLPSAAVFMEIYHWHTGKEVEDTYWAETERQGVATKWLNRPLWDYQKCHKLSLDQQMRVKHSNHLSNKDRGAGELQDAQERDSKLRTVVHSWIMSAASTKEQKYYRFLQSYAATLHQAKYAKQKHMQPLQ